MNSFPEQPEQNANEVEASWHRQRSDSELHSFIERQHNSLSEDFDFVLDGLF